MLTKEKNIRAAIAEGKQIYEIPAVCPFVTEKPSKTEPGQALSIRARVQLAEAGIGSMGITDDMFDFDENMTVDEAIEKTGALMLPAGVSSLYDLLERRVALLQREFYEYASENHKKMEMEKGETMPPAREEGASEK